MTQEIPILTWREAVRKRPAMYIGSTGFQGFVHILKDFFAPFYAYLDASKFAHGRPIKILEAERFSFHITGNNSGVFRADRLKRSVSANINEDLSYFGFDFAVLNALSEKYEFSLFDETGNLILEQSYQQGILQSGEVSEKEFFADALQVEFKLDFTILEEFEINPYYIADLLEELAFLNQDKIFELKYTVNDEPCRIIYNFENGLRDLVRIKGLNGIGPAIFLSELKYQTEEFTADICFSFWDYSINEPFFKSFVNNFYTHQGGTHKKAFLSGIERALKEYVKKHKPDEFFVITERTILSCLIGAIHLKMKQPTFEGSTKNKLANREIVEPISEYVFQEVFKKLVSDEETATKVIRHFYEIHWNKKWLKRL